MGNGAMAEGLGTGLQNLLQQFESAWHLIIHKIIVFDFRKEFAQASSFFLYLGTLKNEKDFFEIFLNPADGAQGKAAKAAATQ